MDRIEWTDELVERVRTLAASGLSFGAIGNALGISKNAVIGKCRRAGITSQHEFKAHPKKPRQPKRAKGATLPPLVDVPIREAPRRVMVAPVKVTAPPPSRRSSEPCCWPIGTPRTPGFRYCDEPSVGGKPYCLTHYSIAYVSVPAREAPSGDGFGRLTRVFGG